MRSEAAWRRTNSDTPIERNVWAAALTQSKSVPVITLALKTSAELDAESAALIAEPLIRDGKNEAVRAFAQAIHARCR